MSEQQISIDADYLREKFDYVLPPSTRLAEIEIQSVVVVHFDRVSKRTTADGVEFEESYRYSEQVVAYRGLVQTREQFMQFADAVDWILNADREECDEDA